MRLEELSDICQKSGAKLKKKMMVAICNYKKDIYTMTTEDWICILKDFKMQMSYISEIRREMTKIYEHEINIGKTVYNPFMSPELSTDNISAQINQFIYVSQEQLDRAVDNLSDSLIGGCISQFMYEGTKSYLDIFNLDMNDIDFKTHKINFKNYSIYGSVKLMNYIKQYDKNEVYVSKHPKSKSGDRTFKLSRVRKNSFAKVIEYSNYTSNTFVSDMAKAFQNSCAQIFMKLGYSNSQIYNSGALNYVLRKCDYSLRELSYLFKDNSRPRGEDTPAEKLNKYVREYGIEGRNARYYLKDYYTSYMIQNAPFE